MFLMDRHPSESGWPGGDRVSNGAGDAKDKVGNPKFGVHTY